MNIEEKVIDIIKGMEGIEGILTDEDFLNEFEFRLQALKQEQTLPIHSIGNSLLEFITYVYADDTRLLLNEKEIVENYINQL